MVPVDASSNQNSGPYYFEKDTQQRDVGSWIILEKEQIQLAPKQQTTLKVTLNIPKDTKAGQHLGGIVVQEATTTTSNNTTDTAEPKQSSFGVKTISRVVMPVLVNVGAIPAPSLKIKSTGVNQVVNASPVLTLMLQNDGGSLIKPKGDILVTDNAGTTVLSQSLSLDSIIPGTSINYPVQANLPKVPGTYKVHASLDFGGTAPAVYDGTGRDKGTTG